MNMLLIGNKIGVYKSELTPLHAAFLPKNKILLIQNRNKS